MKFLKLSLILIIFAVCLGALSCKDNANQDIPEQGSVKLNKDTTELNIGQQILLTPIYSSKLVEEKDFTWSTKSSDIVKITESNKSAVITALKEGNALVKIEANDKSISAICLIVVAKNEDNNDSDAENDDIIRILGIGNSFTVDALEEHYLYELALANEKKIAIAYLVVGGATLEEHLQNAEADKKVYQYVKRDKNGNMVSLSGKSVADGVLDERWDYISFQQQSWLSGQPDSYTPYIPKLVNYVKSKSQNSNTTYCILQTWAFADDYTYSDYDYYNNDQLTMHKALVDAANKARNLTNPQMTIIPAGTAIQNGRTSSIGDKFCRDGYHLNMDIGRFTVACTWYEAIFKDNVVNNTYKPPQLSDFQIKVAKNAAHYAIAKPEDVTEMVDFQ